MKKPVKKIQIGISLPLWMAERLNNDMSGTNSEIVMDLLIKKYGDFYANIELQKTNNGLYDEHAL